MIRLTEKTDKYSRTILKHVALEDFVVYMQLNVFLDMLF